MTQRRYLLVDDNGAFAENLAEILDGQGAAAVVATAGADALALLSGTRFDALVTDMKMPGMSGAELVREARRRDPGLAALVLTAYTGIDDLQTATDQGLLAVLPKPVPLHALFALLAAARRDGLVLLVEDDAGLAENLGELLRVHGFSSIVLRSLLECRQLRGLRPFAALVDLRLPGAPDGAALGWLEETFPRMPRLVMTGFPEAPAARQEERLFIKPFATPKLLDALERLHAGAA